MTTRDTAIGKIVDGLRDGGDRVQYLIYGYRADRARSLLDEVWERVEPQHLYLLRRMNIERVTPAPGTDRRYTPAVLALGSGSYICGMRFNGVVLDTKLVAAWRAKQERDQKTWYDPLDSRIRQDGWIFQLDM